MKDTTPKRANRVQSLHFNCSEFLLDKEYGLYVEDYFQEMISAERKRSERTKRPFLLVLFDFADLSGDERIFKITRAFAETISAATRETDIKGWYRNRLVIGLILTEVMDEDTPVRDRVQKNLTELALRHDEGLYGKVKVTVHPFPEAKNGERTSLDPALYPDTVKKNSTDAVYLKFKRALDVTGALTALVLFSPLFILMPILIKATSKGPVLFRQTRVGEFGRPFVFLKFRSMYTGSDEAIHSKYVKSLILEEKPYKDGDGARVYKIKDDPRVTPLGKFLRKTSLDELPQFINVLQGFMSIVGPRPPIPYELDSYDLWHKKRLQEIKPGITGLWQVKGRSMTTFNEMVRMDIEYIESRSLWLDLKIILKTPWSMLNNKGAY